MQWLTKYFIQIERFCLTLLYPKRKKWLQLFPQEHPKALWFHAASAGELESLIPVIECATQHIPVIITVFSFSGLSALEKFAKQCSACLYAGLSPMEGQWKHYLVNIVGFVTVKYEAWPDLWIQLSLKQIPLFLLNARQRNSYKIADFFCWLAKVPPLQKTFFCLSQKDVAYFSSQQIQTVYVEDPRLSRIMQRKKKKHERVEQIRSLWKKQGLGGILGNIWISDLKKLPSISWPCLVVPHNVSVKNVRSIQKYLGWPLSSQNVCASQLIVDEIGFLLELYALADWAYVGGGFFKGVHSALEPACYGLPIACGPKRVKTFPELDNLIDNLQLTVIKNQQDFMHWYENFAGKKNLFLQRMEKPEKKIWEEIYAKSL